MKRYLLCFILFITPLFTFGQFLHQFINFVDSSVYPVNLVPDTATSPLWQLGTTTKVFFCSDTVGCHAVMTDTATPYPINANNWFTVKFTSPFVLRNPRIDIWHRYQTDSGKDGGIIEFSTDSGATWLNVVGGCNNSGPLSTIEVDSFYSANDTLPDGSAAFTGSGIRHSILMFWDCLGVKTTILPACSFAFSDQFYLRFRFVSDTVADTLSGWKIDSIRMTEQDCPGSVGRVNTQQQLVVMPIPAHNELTIVSSGNIANVLITNIVGQPVLRGDYNGSEAHIDISALPSGLYFARINGSEIRRFIKE